MGKRTTNPDSEDAQSQGSTPKGGSEYPQNSGKSFKNIILTLSFVSQYGECLVAYPPEQWDEIEAKALHLSQVHPEHRSFLRRFISGAEDCEFDNQGRVLIPPLLREDAHLNQEVVLVGMLSNFEIWDKSTYDLQVERDRQNEQKVMETIAITGL